MNVRFGYACINETIKTVFKTCRVATAEKEGQSKIKELALHNLREVERALRWNAENNIFFFRVSSDIVPLATHPVNKWAWDKDEDVLALCASIKGFKSERSMRLSCHPGQYTVINSPNLEVVSKSVQDLAYHEKLMELLGGEDIILHIGGAYGDKPKAIERFAESYTALSEGIKRRLRIENDDRTFTYEEVLAVHQRTGAPICFDIHHHRCNPCKTDLREAMNDIFASWKGFGKPKMHISTGRERPDDRAHSDYISEENLKELLALLGGRAADIMFEAKKKEQAVMRLLGFQG